MKKSCLVIILGVLAACAFMATAQPQRSPAPAPSHEVAPPGLTGTIRDAAGKPLNGVVVSARASDQTFTTSVYTDDHGVYVFPHLAGGNYKLWAQSTTFSTARAELTLDGSRTANRDLTLKPLANFEAQLTGVEWYDSLPDGNVNQRRMKQVMYVACTGCHSLDLVLQNKFNEAGWNAIVRSMASGTFNGWNGSFDKTTSWQGQIMSHHTDELAKYLAEVRGPDSPPLALKPLSRPTGEAARVVITEYELPIAERANEMPWYTGTDWMLGPSTGMHGTVGVHDVLADAAGNAWITQSRFTFETNRTVVKLDPKTGQMKAFKLAGADGKTIFVDQITADPAGDIWMHDKDAGGSVVRINPATETFTLFPMPRPMGQMLNSMDADSKGRIFLNAHNGITEFNPAEQNNKNSAYPGWHLFQQLTPGDGVTYGISADADDNLWWSESYVDKVAKRDMKTGKVYELDMRDSDYDARKSLATPADLEFYESIGGETWSGATGSPVPYADMPRRLAADKNGNTVWVPNWAQSTVAEIDIHTMKVTYHKLPIPVHPYKTTVDKQHNVWADAALADAVFKFTPATQTWTMYPLPTHGCSSRHISFDDVRGELWLPCDQADKVARFQFRTAGEMRALEAAATH